MKNVISLIFTDKYSNEDQAPNQDCLDLMCNKYVKG